jgi:DNA (cytosine-5)-methyltransferase 1
MRDYYEFFAGGGMVRAGLGSAWRCLFANDFDHKKSRTYIENWGDGELKTADVGTLKTGDLPASASLAWASFPCQDLSLAGGGAGLKGDRSGTFWPFWNLLKELVAEGRSPSLVVLENVCGTLHSHDGKDFATICNAFQQAEYRVGALVIDAALFVPQSRPRLFLIGVREDVEIPEGVTTDSPQNPWHTSALKTTYANLSPKAKRNWLWWKLPLPGPRKKSFSDIIEENPKSVEWFSGQETKQLLGMMSEINRAKVIQAKKERRRMIGGLYRRTRRDDYGRKVQRAEIRFDDISGCLRTPVGGSSRQSVLIVNGQSIKARLISSRETARLMGLSDEYKLPKNYNEAYHLTGDGVVVPVVRHLAAHIFEPILDSLKARATQAA